MEKIYLSSPHMSEEGYERNYIKEAFDTNWIAPLGVNVDKFEEELSSYVGIEHGSALSSGTAAIHLALKLANVGKDDIVLCQSLTFSATANPITYVGATPVFIDSEYKTWNMCPKALEEGLKKYPKTKAVLVVNLYGFAAQLDVIKEICDRYNVILIEDAAESLGSKYDGKFTGTYGKYGIYSFNGNKIITTSGGGMLVSNEEKDIKKARFYATQSRENERHYEHKEIGFNYRMSNVVAGIGRGQLKVLTERVKQKKHIYEYYKMQLGGLEGIEFMPINEKDEPNYWLTCVLLRGKTTPMHIIEALEKENIESRPLWKPMHMQPVFAKCDCIDYGVASDLFAHGLCLPSDTKMTDEALNRVCNIIKKVWKD